jgi:hypothetical protein
MNTSYCQDIFYVNLTVQRSRTCLCIICHFLKTRNVPDIHIFLSLKTCKHVLSYILMLDLQYARCLTNKKVQKVAMNMQLFVLKVATCILSSRYYDIHTKKISLKSYTLR